MTEWIAGAAWSAASGQLGPEPCNPEDSCGERAIAQDVEAFYDAIEIALVIDIIVDIFWPPAAAAIPYLVNILKDMDIADAAFDLFMDFPGDGSSDGIVDGPGQIYNDANPGAVQYPINNADSHSAALKSTYDRPVLDTILENQFHVPTQATCTFGASPTSLSPSALATSGSFNVLTARRLSVVGIQQCSLAQYQLRDQRHLERRSRLRSPSEPVRASTPGRNPGGQWVVEYDACGPSGWRMHIYAFTWRRDCSPSCGNKCYCVGHHSGQLPMVSTIQLELAFHQLRRHGYRFRIVWLYSGTQP